MSATRRRFDEDALREKILQTTLEVVALHGVSGTTHRKIATAADVPLGTITHRYASLEHLLEAAFRRLGHQISAHYERVLGEAVTRRQARQAIVALICDGLWVTPQTLALTYELYAWGSRNDLILELRTEWMRLCQSLLQRHFTPATTRLLDAFIEGATMHNDAVPGSLSREEISRAVEALAPGD